ncbi:MAG: metalloregulator ArsR/SmtB family transcription factor [bacterium]
MTETTPGSGPDPAPCCDVQVRPLLEEEQSRDLADQVQILAHPIRLQILGMLARHGGSVCVCDLTAVLPVKQPTISHHLGLMKAAGLVRHRRRGKWIYYRIDAGRLTALREQLDGILGIFEEAQEAA